MSMKKRNSSLLRAFITGALLSGVDRPLYPKSNLQTSKEIFESNVNALIVTGSSFWIGEILFYQNASDMAFYRIKHGSKVSDRISEKRYDKAYYRHLSPKK